MKKAAWTGGLLFRLRQRLLLVYTNKQNYMNFFDKMFFLHVTPSLLKFVKQYSSQLIRSKFRRMSIKYLSAFTVLLSLILFFNFSDVSEKLLAVIFSIFYLVFVVDFLIQAIRNSRFYYRIIRYNKNYIVRELMRIKPFYVTVVQYVFVYRGSLPSDKDISNTIVQHIRLRLLILILFSIFYFILYRALVFQLVPLWGDQVDFYEQPLKAVETIFNLF